MIERVLVVASCRKTEPARHFGLPKNRWVGLMKLDLCQRQPLRARSPAI